jgi:hypothetical protein
VCDSLGLCNGGVCQGKIIGYIADDDNIDDVDITDARNNIRCAPSAETLEISLRN